MDTIFWYVLIFVVSCPKLFWLVGTAEGRAQWRKDIAEAEAKQKAKQKAKEDALTPEQKQAREKRHDRITTLVIMIVTAGMLS